jgi:hypothetical protein
MLALVRSTGLLLLAGSLAASTALAQGAGATPDASQPRAQASAAGGELQAACADLVRSGGEGADPEIRDACAEMIRMAAQPQQPARSAQRGGGGDVQEGNRVLAAFSQAGDELVSRPGQGIGMLRRGFARNSITTDPVSTFTGEGFNLRYSRVVQPKLSAVIGGRYSSTEAFEGEITAYGINGGVDYFLFGRNNEGLYLGPRAEVGFGTTDVTGGPEEDFGRLGAGGEVGYRFVATNGVTAAAGFGLNARVTGETDETLDALGDPDLGAYLRFGVGYTW